MVAVGGRAQRVAGSAAVTAGYDAGLAAVIAEPLGEPDYARGFAGAADGEVADAHDCGGGSVASLPATVVGEVAEPNGESVGEGREPEEEAEEAGPDAAPRAANERQEALARSILAKAFRGELVPQAAIEIFDDFCVALHVHSRCEAPSGWRLETLLAHDPPGNPPPRRRPTAKPRIISKFQAAASRANSPTTCRCATIWLCGHPA